MQRELSEEEGYDAVTLKAGICEKVDKTAAEIETKEQLDQFIQMGYDYAMGSYFSGVMTADEFETLIEKEINK